ncbi:MAG TPA: hypothetical protein VIW94_04850 [Acidimicrobiia bacterium]
MTDQPEKDGFTQGDPDAPIDELEPNPPQTLGVAWGFVAFLIFAAVAAIFIFQNNEAIPVRYLWYDFSVDLWVVVMGIVLFTLIADQVVSLLWRRRKRKKIAAKAVKN